MVEVIDSNISYLPFPTLTGDGLAVRGLIRTLSVVPHLDRCMDWQFGIL